MNHEGKTIFSHRFRNQKILFQAMLVIKTATTYLQYLIKCTEIDCKPEKVNCTRSKRDVNESLSLPRCR